MRTPERLGASLPWRLALACESPPSSLGAVSSDSVAAAGAGGVSAGGFCSAGFSSGCRLIEIGESVVMICW